MSELKIAKGLALPLDAVTQTIGIVAKKRSGKSYLARRLTEQLHHGAQQVVIVDPKGDWWGIRSSSDGKGPGLPIIIIGGERADVPLEAGGGEVIAKLVVEERVSVLLDLSLLRKHEVATFMTAFLEGLYRLKAVERNRTPVMLVIDEADAIAPQKPQPNEARMLGAAEDIVRRGGQRGIGCTMVTQRTAVLNKNILTQCQVLIALRTIGPQDLAALNAWVDVHGTPEQRKTLMATLPSLPVGDAWVWSPGWPTDAGIFQRMHTLPIETFDSGATPKPGQKRVDPKRMADVDLEAVRTQMAATIERAKADDPKELRKRVAELERELAKGKAAGADTEEVKLLRADVASLRGNVQFLRTGMDAARNLLDDLENLLGPARKLIASREVMRAHAELSEREGELGVPVAHNHYKAAEDPKTGERIYVRKIAPKPARAAGPGTDMPEGERAILIAAAQTTDGATREQLSILTGYKRSTRDAYIQRLRGKGYLDESGGRIHANEAGILALGADYEPLPTGAALLDHWLAKLPAGESLVLRMVAQSYPRRVTREAISEQTGFKRSTRDAYIQRLSTRRLVVAERDGVVASKELIDG